MTFNKRLLGALMAGVTLLLPACATVIRGPNVAFEVATEPPGATVTTDLLTKESRRAKQADPDAPANYRGCSPTPCKFQVSRRAEFIATVTMPGYHPATVDVTSGFGSGGSAASATGAVLVAGSAYSTIYGLASFWPAVFQSSANAGAAAGATQAATGVGLLFLGVDVATGAMLNVRPNPMVLILVPEDEEKPENVYIETEEELRELLEAPDASDETDDIS
ncbi:MAG: hypothetical protein AAFO74_10025 [Pseudomonadota bacterium]